MDISQVHFLHVFCILGHLPKLLAYRWPLANYTGGAEVLYGNNNGKVGCTVVTGPKPPLVPYYGMYFDGSVSSYVEIGMGTEKNLSDWAFVVFLFLYDLTGGTILHYKYDGPTVLSPSYSDEIRIWLNGSHIMLIIRGPSGEDFGTVAVQHGFIVGQRTWLMFSHGYNDGRIIIRSLDSVLYDSYTATNFVYIHQPAKIKLAGSYGYEALPFKGSIVCLGVYDLTMTYDDIKMSLYSCDPRYWNTIPASIDLPSPNCPNNRGYFSTVSKDSRPYPTFTPIYTVHIESVRQCAATCLQETQCESVAYEKNSRACLLYGGIYETNLEGKIGNYYYKRRDICC